MHKSILIHHAANNQWLYSEADKIVRLGQGKPDLSAEIEIDADGKHLLPGFIDVHVHGAMGHDTMDATPQALQTMAQFYAQHGVTSFLATTWTDLRHRIINALENVKQCLGSQENGATLLGVHLEGPYLNSQKCGAQNINFLRLAAEEEARTFMDIGVIRLLSLAPEFPDHEWLIREAVQRGITVSAAHTAANYDDIHRVASIGLTHATHTFNAMTGLHHREPGTVGAVLVHASIRCELIADNVHVHPAVMNLAWKAKGQDGIVLVSDAVRVAGLDDGEYALDKRPVVVKDNSVRLADGTLAGSLLTMDQALKNFMKATHEPIENVWQVSSLNPARAIGVDNTKGSLEIGKDADFILADDQLVVYLTVANGKIVFRREL